MGIKQSQAHKVLHFYFSRGFCHKIVSDNVMGLFALPNFGNVWVFTFNDIRSILSGVIIFLNMTVSCRKLKLDRIRAFSQDSFKQCHGKIDLFQIMAMFGSSHLTILDNYGAKIAKICNFWTFLHLWSIGQEGFLLDFEKMVY